jgi:hypothetical protein
MGKNFKAAVSCSSHCNFGCVSWRIVVQEQNALRQFAPPLTHDFLTQTSHFVCIIFPADGTLLNFFEGDEPGCFHCMLVFLDSGSK